MKTTISSSEVYSEQKFNGLDLSRQEIRDAEFYACKFQSCTMQEVALLNCRFDDCVFKDCDLSLIKITKSRFQDCEFKDCRLVGVNWTEAELSKSRLKSPFSFEGCALNHSTFINMRLNGLVMKDCTVRNVDFSEVSLQKAVFRSSDLEESRFAHTDLSEADLRGAKNYNIDPNLNTLKATRFSLPEALSLLYNLDIILDE